MLSGNKLPQIGNYSCQNLLSYRQIKLSTLKLFRRNITTFGWRHFYIRPLEPHPLNYSIFISYNSEIYHYLSNVASKKEIRFVIIGKEEFLISYVTKTIFAFIFTASTKRYFTNLIKINALFLPRKRKCKEFLKRHCFNFMLFSYI